MNIATLTTTLGLVTTLGGVGGGGYLVSEALSAKADRAEVLAVNSKTDYIIDKQMEGTLSQINKLESQKKKSEDDREQLRYLREELQRSREIRKQR